MNWIVVGSGPAGVAAAKALSDAGRPVTIVDAGRQSDADLPEPFEALATVEPSDWPSGVAHRLRGTFPVGVKSVGLKPAFGSLFPYAIDDPDLLVSRDHAEILPSLARGGLSNTWGASMLPYRQTDIADWPISMTDLAPHYESVLRFVPMAGAHDELEPMFPLYCEPGRLQRYPQAEMVLGGLRRHARGLSERGFAFGGSRLAVRTQADDDRHCRYSGLCMYGCPYRSIYAAGQTLDDLIHSGVVTYRPGVYVDRVEEHGDRVRVHAHERGASGTRAELEAERVFIACGAISSTRLVLESLGHRGPRRLVDSHYFMIPLLTERAAPVAAADQGNTLAQAFLELEDESISRHTIHMQIYTYNDLMLGTLASRLPLAPETLERATRPLLGRLVVIQGYLHSSESAGLTLTPQAEGLRLDGERAPSAVNRLARRLAASARLLRMAPIPALLQPGAPGKGNHVGGSLPMRHDPADLESDVLGRPRGFTRVHVVDASVFPSVPATTVTLSVMANAHRIATAAARLQARPA
jgi:choline dehydrogenase-like flavoprotein